MNTLGTLVLASSLGILLFSLGNSLIAIFKNDERARELGRTSLLANCFLILLAFLILLIQLFRGDLTNHYVIMHSSVYLPVFYQMTSIWSGSSGSLLFWNLLLSVFTFVVLRQSRKMHLERLPVMHAILATLSLFFTFLAVFFQDAQPFLEVQPAAKIGRGLNPLLQHWAMIIHPPILYLGYVSIAIPFAIAMSALFTGRVSEDWMKFVRKWSLFSWFFLGTGILLGSKWAYEELGWGGYWAWDPVENASLMPWLLMSAFVHSVIIQERRGMLKFWNMILIDLAFHFSLLGTWITRSGVLEGPHSFSKSTIGEPFIILIGTSFLFFTGSIIYKRKELEPERVLESVTSREGSFLLNNFLLVFACLAILLGVFSPLLYGKEFKSPWYNSWGVPLGIFLLLLMGSAPLLAWRKSVDKIFYQSLWKPSLAGLLGGLLYLGMSRAVFTSGGNSYSDYLGEVYSFLTVTAGVFTLAGIVQEYRDGILARRTSFPEETFFQAGIRMLLKNKRRYGGYLVHVSMVLLFLGYAGNAFKQNLSIPFHYQLSPPTTTEVIYTSMDKGIVGNYQIQAETLKLKPLWNQDSGFSPNLQNVTVSEEALFQVYRGESRVTNLTTERRFYPQVSHLTGNLETHIPTSEPAIYSIPKEDLYIQLGAIEDVITSKENPNFPILFLQYFFASPENNLRFRAFTQFPTQIVAHLEVWVNPLTQLIWIGSLMYFLSGLFILLPIGEKKSGTVS